MVNRYKFNVLQVVLHHIFTTQYFLGAPSIPEQKTLRNLFLQRLGAKFTDGKIDETAVETGRAAELAGTYFNQVIDRQISKAGGLLTFNSILLAVIFTHDLFANNKDIRTIIAGLLLFSCMPLLDMLVAIWAQPEVYGSALQDLDDSLRTCSFRSRLLVMSTIPSFVAVISVLGMELWGS